MHKSPQQKKEIVMKKKKIKRILTIALTCSLLGYTLLKSDVSVLFWNKLWMIVTIDIPKSSARLRGTTRSLTEQQQEEAPSSKWLGSQEVVMVVDPKSPAGFLVAFQAAVKIAVGALKAFQAQVFWPRSFRSPFLAPSWTTWSCLFRLNRATLKASWGRGWTPSACLF